MEQPALTWDDSNELLDFLGDEGLRDDDKARFGLLDWVSLEALEGTPPMTEAQTPSQIEDLPWRCLDPEHQADCGLCSNAPSGEHAGFYVLDREQGTDNLTTSSVACVNPFRELNTFKNSIIRERFFLSCMIARQSLKGRNQEFLFIILVP